MPYRLDPQVAGELGDGTELDSSMHPPRVSRVDYVLDRPDADALVQSFPVYLVTVELGRRLQLANLTGFSLGEALVRPSENFISIYGDVPHPQYVWLQVDGELGQDDCWIDPSFQICVSDRMMVLIDGMALSDCLVEEIVK